MSAFGKPLTTTKSRPSCKPSTSIDSKSMSNICRSNSSSSINLSSSTKILDEINLLLYLETLKRSRDTEIILRQKIEDAYKLFEERRHKYHNLVAKYATLVKLAYTHKVLVCNELIDLPTASARSDAKHIKEKLSSGCATDYINTTELNKFKQMLSQIEKYQNLPIRSSELADLQNATDAIQSSIEAIEILLEKCIVQGMDHFTDMLDMSNYPKLQMEHGHNE